MNRASGAVNADLPGNGYAGKILAFVYHNLAPSR